MPQTPYNSILNQGWFARLSAQINENRMRNVQATGSEADDPYFAAKAAQQQGDLESARKDANQARYNAGQAQTVNNIRNARYRDAQRQRVISSALAKEAAANESVLFGSDTQAPALPPMPQAPQAPAMPTYRPPETPPAYVPVAPKPMRASGFNSAYGVPSQRSAYNPQQFENPVLEKKKKSLNDYYAQLARLWR